MKREDYDTTELRKRLEAHLRRRDEWRAAARERDRRRRERLRRLTFGLLGR